MRIGEIADKTGLSISNIRFYEKKGLIGPDREADNKYRNYSEEDLARLKLIILYRKMDIPVETISRILTEEITVQEAVEAQLLELESKKQMIQGSIDLCNKVMEMAPNLTMISKDGKHSDTSDIESLLSYVKEEEQQGKVFGNIDELLEDFAQITVPSNLYFNRGLFPRFWMYRTVQIFWGVFFGLMPVIAIVSSLFDESGINPGLIAFWCIIIIVYVISLIMFLGKRKGKR